MKTAKDRQSQMKTAEYLLSQPKVPSSQESAQSWRKWSNMMYIMSLLRFSYLSVYIKGYVSEWVRCRGAQKYKKLDSELAH